MSTAATQPKFSSVAELRDSIVSSGNMDAAWAAKMLHQVPEMKSVKDRAAFLVELAKDRVVLDIGCTGAISKQIKLAAKTYYGVDKVSGDGIEVVDIDHRPDKIPVHVDVEQIICSEVLEHLANPGYFLLALKKLYAGKNLCITVPNAGSFAVRGDCEVVNGDHVSWYSYTTLSTLLSRYGLKASESLWFNGPPHKAEGLIMKVTL